MGGIEHYIFRVQLRTEIPWSHLPKKFLARKRTVISETSELLSAQPVEELPGVVGPSNQLPLFQSFAHMKPVFKIIKRKNWSHPNLPCNPSLREALCQGCVLDIRCRMFRTFRGELNYFTTTVVVYFKCCACCCSNKQEKRNLLYDKWVCPAAQ